MRNALFILKYFDIHSKIIRFNFTQFRVQQDGVYTMLANTCQQNIQCTLDNAMKSTSGPLRVEVNNAKQKIAKIFEEYTSLKKLKISVRHILDNLNIFSDFKQKIQKLLKKLK